MDLLSSYPLGCSLNSPSEDGTTLLRVARMLVMEELEFPVLLDKSVGEETIVAECGPEDCRKHECGLQRG